MRWPKSPDKAQRGRVMGIIAEIYRRAFATARHVPLLLILPAAAELAQHAVEIRLGLYAGNAAAAVSPLRLILGAVKVVAILATLLVALRRWRARYEALVLRPGRRLIAGFLTILLVQVGGELLLVVIGSGIARLLHAGRAGHAVAVVAPVILWLFLVGALIPWYVGLLTEDRMMTLRRAWGAMRSRLSWAFGVQLAGYLPLLIAHYLLGYGAMGRRATTVWLLMIVDAGVVGLLALAIGSTYYALYRSARFQKRTDGAFRAFHSPT